MNTKREESFNRALGLRLMVLRQSKKISQGYLGVCIGVSGQQIQKYENGINRITPEKLALCAEILKVPIGYFYGENEDSLKQYDRNALYAVADIECLPEEVKQGVYHLVKLINKSWREHSNDRK
ncbi:MAG: helix-turn-helix transcriptional regulator [Pseudomonadota bacterium]